MPSCSRQSPAKRLFLPLHCSSNRTIMMEIVSYLSGFSQHPGSDHDAAYLVTRRYSSGREAGELQPCVLTDCMLPFDSVYTRVRSCACNRYSNLDDRRCQRTMNRRVAACQPFHRRLPLSVSVRLADPLNTRAGSRTQKSPATYHVDVPFDDVQA